MPNRRWFATVEPALAPLECGRDVPAVQFPTESGFDVTKGDEGDFEEGTRNWLGG